MVIRSRALSLLFTLAAIVALSACRHEKTQSRTSSVGKVSSPDILDWPDVSERAPASALSGRRVILIGWDGADWELLDSLTAEGRMPNLARLEAEGRTAELESYPPTVSPMVWTTIATGAEPSDHGVLDFFEIEPKSGKYVPVSAESREVPSYWDVASARGQKVGVVNFWATFPAEEVRGFFVSDRACPALVDPDPAQLPSAVYPPAYADGVRALLDSHPLPGGEVLARFGDFSGAEEKGTSAGMTARLLRNTRVVQETAEKLYDRERPQSLAVYFLGTDEISHLFGEDAAPKLPCVPEDLFRRYREVVPRYYAWMDRLLGRWMRRAREDGAALILVSDHGFKWGPRRSCGGNPLERRSAVYSHRPEGIAAAWGAGVLHGAGRSRASVFDVAPTVSALLRLPVDRREPGRARTEWFSGVSAPAAADLWKGMPAARLLPPIDAGKTDEYAQRLANLGYLAGSLPTAVAAPGGTRPGKTETGYLNLGAWHNSKGEWEAAVADFRGSLRVRPGYPPAEVNLVGGLLRLGRKAEALAVAMDSLRHPGERLGWAVYEMAARFEKDGRMQDEERFLLEAVRRLPASEPVAASLGGLRLGQGRCAESLEIVRPYLGTAALPDTLNVAGFSLECVKRPAEARPYLERSLALNPSQPAVRQALAEK
jgi:predicted AlkP superfamily phosphohydrolase/phosphomutase/tetratricopeptide (TPR) repeat protein